MSLDGFSIRSVRMSPGGESREGGFGNNSPKSIPNWGVFAVRVDFLNRSLGIPSHLVEEFKECSGMACT